ncbi:sulfotransferase [Mycobacterium sp. E796]|uniref:sulfotransferase n=1 Tax=Mycobacterium sp. E796 TaxID=1834151 RepID=UPI0007FEB4AF|nr:sulfotransferase [Mycobacterium sp. E796]OBI53705.1 hypothetical protein A5706_22200 [Mycobacterium sp. E796]
MAIEISEVALCPIDDLITAANVDYPPTGPVDGYVFEVFGWVVGKAPIAEVQFVHEESVIACCELDVWRPDIAETFGSSSQAGFWKAIGTVGLAAAFTVEVWVVFQDGRRREIAKIRGTQQLTSAFIPSMQPIIVTSIGRSGSTRLVRMLAEHPDIIVEERFPYETFVCSYWMHFMHVLAAPADTSQDESWQFWALDPKRLPPCPYYFLPEVHVPYFYQPLAYPTPAEHVAVERWYFDQVEEFARVAQAAVESFYREYARTRKRTTPAFFVEKSLLVPTGHIRPIMRQLYPRGREIFLLRDPRDRLASVLAFNAFRGYHEFGRQLVDTDEQYVDVIRMETLSLIQMWKSTSRREPLVRYEDLIRSPTKQIRAMLDALELDSSANIVKAMVKAGDEGTDNVKEHRTSPDARSSIGRWKRDLEPRLQEICDEAFDGLLDELDGSSC